METEPIRPVARPGQDEADRIRSELDRSERMRRALADLIITLGSNLGLDALLARVCSILDEAYESIASLIYLWDPEIARFVIWVYNDKPLLWAHHDETWCPEPGMATFMQGPIVSFVRGRLSIPMVEQIQLRMGEGLVGWAAERREPLVIGHEPWKDPRNKPFPEIHEERGKSVMLVPIILANQEVLGVISLWSTRPNHFTEEHVRVLRESMGLLGTVIEKIRLDQELSRRAKVLAFLGQLCGELSSLRPVEELMDSVAAHTAEVMASDACIVVTVDRDEGRFTLRGLSPNQLDAVAAIDGRLGAGTGSHDQLFRDLAQALPERFAEACSAPLLAGAEHLGFITCYRHKRYSSADRDLLGLIAGPVALGLVALEGAERHADRDDASELLALLASGRAEPAVIAMAASLGLDLGNPHVLLQARFLPADRNEAASGVSDRFARAAKQFVRSAEDHSPGSLLAKSRGGVVGLVRMAKLSGGPALQQRLQDSADELAARLGMTVSAGMSSACSDPREYADAYREAAEALEVGSKLRGEGRVVRFEELGPDLYLFRMAGDPRTRRDPWMRALEPLLEHDRRKGGDLLATLDGYLESRGNASVTAQQLGLHRNTLRQRLAKVESLTGISLSETQDWLPLQFAVKLTRMQEEER